MSLLDNSTVCELYRWAKNSEREARWGAVASRALGSRQFEKQHRWQHWSWPTAVCTLWNL